LGRLDELQEGQLEKLVSSLVKFSRERFLLSQAQGLLAHWSRPYGPALIFRRLFEKT